MQSLRALVSRMNDNEFIPADSPISIPGVNGAVAPLRLHPELDCETL